MPLARNIPSSSKSRYQPYQLPQAAIQFAASDDNQPRPPIPTHGEETIQLHHYMEGYFQINPADYPLPHPAEYLYANLPDHQYPYPSISGTALSIPPIAPNTQKDTGTVLQRQRKQKKSPKEKEIICEFQGRECEFMLAKDGGVFKNLAELKYVYVSSSPPSTFFKAPNQWI